MRTRKITAAAASARSRRSESCALMSWLWSWSSSSEAPGGRSVAERVHLRLDPVGHVDGVGARLPAHLERDGGLSVDPVVAGGRLLLEAHAPDVPEAHGSLRAREDDQLLEVGDRGRAGADRQVQAPAGEHDRAGRAGLVQGQEAGAHRIGREPVAGQPVGVQLDGQHPPAPPGHPGEGDAVHGQEPRPDLVAHGLGQAGGRVGPPDLPGEEGPGLLGELVRHVGLDRGRWPRPGARRGARRPVRPCRAARTPCGCRARTARRSGPTTRCPAGRPARSRSPCAPHPPAGPPPPAAR